MRDFGMISPTFWTGNTGRILREMGRDEQLLALFLVTNPNATMIGIYDLPLVLICHYLAWDPEGASKGLRRVSEGGFCQYCWTSEQVFVPEMAAYQCGEPLDPKDNKLKFIKKEWHRCRKSPFYMDFYNRYAVSFSLKKPSETEAPSEGLQSPLQAPPKPGTGTGTGTGAGYGDGNRTGGGTSPSPDLLEPLPENPTLARLFSEWRSHQEGPTCKRGEVLAILESLLDDGISPDLISAGIKGKRDRTEFPRYLAKRLREKHIVKNGPPKRTKAEKDAEVARQRIANGQDPKTGKRLEPK